MGTVLDRCKACGKLSNKKKFKGHCSAACYHGTPDWREATCEVCNKPYTRNTYVQRKCSANCTPACAPACTPTPPSLPNKECIICSGSFTPKNTQSKFCSVECSDKRYSLECVECNQVFYAPSNKTKRCKPCRDKGYIINCHACGTEFANKTKGTKYCGEYCRLNRFGPGYVRQYRIFERDDFTCYYCGKHPMEDDVKLHADHVYPISKGGGHEVSNIITACSACNLGKSATLLKPDVYRRVLEYVRQANSKSNINPNAKLHQG